MHMLFTFHRVARSVQWMTHKEMKSDKSGYSSNRLSSWHIRSHQWFKRDFPVYVQQSASSQRTGYRIQRRLPTQARIGQVVTLMSLFEHLYFILQHFFLLTIVCWTFAKCKVTRKSLISESCTMPLFLNYIRYVIYSKKRVFISSKNI